jgi:hypothetical protein
MLLRRSLAGVVITVALGVAGPVLSQAPMTVREFNRIAGSTPRNPLSMMRPSVRRAWNTMESSIDAARTEEARARASGTRPPFCIPGRTDISPNDFMLRMRAVPASEQGQAINQAVRTWMVERFPCR